MKQIRIFLFVLGYIGLVWAGYITIIKSERIVSNLWFTFVTKQLVSKQSQVPIEKCLLGVYKPELPYTFGPTKDFEDSLGLKFSLVSFYQAWGDEFDHQFNPIVMDAVVKNGKVPMITWEPWVSGFVREGLKPLPERELRSLKDIASGNYDFYIKEWAKTAVLWGKPFFLRFAHEMTNDQYPWGPSNGNTADDYKQAWWHVKQIFDSLGANNVIWVWCPYRQNSLNYYPGKESVDWVAMDVFNYGEILYGEDDRRWMSFDELASPLYSDLVKLQKPIMLAEVGCSDIGGPRDVWFREMAEQLGKKFNSIKIIVLFENPTDLTSKEWEIDWTIEKDMDALKELKYFLRNGKFTYLENYLQLLSN